MTQQFPEQGVRRIGWQSPIDLGHYDRSPALTASEKTALDALVQRRIGRRASRWPVRAKKALARLLQPLLDVLDLTDARDGHQAAQLRSNVVRVLADEMQRRGTTYWAWSHAAWRETVGPTAAAYRRGACYDGPSRSRIMLLAYLFADLRDWTSCGASLQQHKLACHIFGDQAVEAAIDRVYAVIHPWGYGPDARRRLSTTLSALLLWNRSPHLEDLTVELLSHMRDTVGTHFQSNSLGLLARALAHLGLTPGYLSYGTRPTPLRERVGVDGVAPEWVAWVFRWHDTSRISTVTKQNYVYKLLRVGRWLAQRHPNVTSPEQWTYELAAAYVAAVNEMTVGEFTTAEDYVRFAPHLGKPLRPNSKVHQLTVLRAFFRDLQEEPHNLPRRFSPDRALRAPASLRRLLGPDPRVIDFTIWARLIRAAETLTAAAIVPDPTGLRYPIELLRAVAVVWCYSGLRANEITRLRIGCIRWQKEVGLTTALPKGAADDGVCFLSVPVHKTGTAFTKPVHGIVGTRIAAWEAVRPAQPRTLDPKTNELVDFLFCWHGKRLSVAHINRFLIPTLCKVANVPTVDERGAITSHRARATIATMLFNAPEGMSLPQLMEWLGHRSMDTTRHYAKVLPTKMAKAYSEANYFQRAHMIPVLVDTRADAYGEVDLYYDLGDGLCSNPEWARCPFRLGCLKCPLYVPEDAAQQIRARDGIKHFMEMVPLTEDEEAVANGDVQKLTELIERNKHLPIPRRSQRRSNVTQQGIPLPVINTRPVPDLDGAARGDASQEAWAEVGHPERWSPEGANLAWRGDAP